MDAQPGWYPEDPAVPEQLRWWDGSRWTEHRAEVAVPVAESPQDDLLFSQTAAELQQRLAGSASLLLNNTYLLVDRPRKVKDVLYSTTPLFKFWAWWDGLCADELIENRDKPTPYVTPALSASQKGRDATTLLTVYGMVQVRQKVPGETQTINDLLADLHRTYTEAGCPTLAGACANMSESFRHPKGARRMTLFKTPLYREAIMQLAVATFEDDVEAVFRLGGLPPYRRVTERHPEDLPTVS